MNIDRMDQISPNHAGGLESKHPLEKPLKNVLNRWLADNGYNWFTKREIIQYFNRYGIQQILDMYLENSSQVDFLNEEALYSLVDEVLKQWLQNR